MRVQFQKRFDAVLNVQANPVTTDVPTFLARISGSNNPEQHEVQ